MAELDRERLIQMLADGLISQDEFERLLRSNDASESRSTMSTPPAEPVPHAEVPKVRRRWIVPVTLVLVLGVVGAVLAVVLLGGDDVNEVESVVPSTEGQSASTEPSEGAEVKVVVNVTADVTGNPLPDLELRFGAEDGVGTYRIFAGENVLAVPRSVLEDARTDDRLRIGLSEDGTWVPLYGSQFIRNEGERVLNLDFADFEMDASGPWLEPFNYERPNPNLDKDCQYYIDSLDERNGFSEVSEAEIEFRLNNSPLSAWQESYRRVLLPARAEEQVVSRWIWTYFGEVEEVVAALRERNEIISALTVAPDFESMNFLIGQYNENIGRGNRAYSDLDRAYSVLC